MGGGAARESGSNPTSSSSSPLCAHLRGEGRPSPGGSSAAAAPEDGRGSWPPAGAPPAPPRRPGGGLGMPGPCGGRAGGVPRGGAARAPRERGIGGGEPAGDRWRSAGSGREAGGAGASPEHCGRVLPRWARPKTPPAHCRATWDPSTPAPNEPRLKRPLRALPGAAMERPLRLPRASSRAFRAIRPRAAGGAAEAPGGEAGGQEPRQPPQDAPPSPEPPRGDPRLLEALQGVQAADGAAALEAGGAAALGCAAGTAPPCAGLRRLPSRCALGRLRREGCAEAVAGRWRLCRCRCCRCRTTHARALPLRAPNRIAVRRRSLRRGGAHPSLLSCTAPSPNRRAGS